MSTKSKNSKTGLFIAAVIFAGAGVFLLFSWFQNMQMARASKHWPSTEGRVISSEVVRVLKSTDKKGKSHYVYPARVKYSYSVEGQSYIAGRISFGDYSTSSRSHGAEIVAKYPPGKTVRVFYDPDAPMHAVLERRVGLGHFLKIVLGFLFLLGALLLLWSFFLALFRGR